MGCVICERPAHVHHLTGAGMGLKSKDKIPLCPEHHQHGGYGVAIHAGEQAFEKNFGTQQELLKKTIEKLEFD